MMTIAAVVPTTPRCVMAINQADQPALNKRASQHLSNGPTEGLNNKTRLITRRSYGFHSAKPLIAMILLCCGGITLAPPLPSPQT